MAADATRVRFAPAEGAARLFTPTFCEYLARLHDALGARALELRARRDEGLRRALRDHVMPGHPPPSAATTGDWRVPPVPDELRKPGIEISGPCSITPMFINALNPGPEGERAEGDLDDDEDSGGPRLIDTVRATENRLAAVNRELAFEDRERGRSYRIAPGELPFFMHRERGLHLDEPDVTVDGQPVNAAILGTALTLFFAGRAQADRGQGIYFYLPKLEHAPEARWYRDLFDRSREHLPGLRNATIRAVVLVESLPCVYEMEKMLWELGPYAAGLNAARWDLKASIFEFVMADPTQVWPDRFGVDIKTTAFLANIFRRLVAICLKRGAVPIGGMATALPSNDPVVNRVAGEAIAKDKEWEAAQGFVRGWVAHIFHMKTAADPFKKLVGSGWTPTPGMAKPEAYPVEIGVAAAARRGRDTLPPGDEGRPALGQELHGVELPEPRLVFACRARRDRPSARRLLRSSKGATPQAPRRARRPPPSRGKRSREGANPQNEVARAKPALDQRLPKRASDPQRPPAVSAAPSARRPPSTTIVWPVSPPVVAR